MCANVCTPDETVLVKRHFETFRAEQIRLICVMVCVFFFCVRNNRIRSECVDMIYMCAFERTICEAPCVVATLLKYRGE